MTKKQPNPAVHEAGHLVIVRHFGWQCTEASIGDVGGSASWSFPPGLGLAAKDQEELIIAVAGAVAEELFGCSPAPQPLVSHQIDNPNDPDWCFDGLDGRPWSDLVRASNLARFLAQKNGKPEKQNILETEKEARDILRKQQHDVLAIACCLATKKQLSAQELDDLLPRGKQEA